MLPMSSRKKILLAHLVPLVICFLLLILCVSLIAASSIKVSFVVLTLMFSFMLLFTIAISYLITNRIVTKFEEVNRSLKDAHNELGERILNRTSELAESESRYKALFDNAEISIWNEDLSTVYRELGNLRKQGVSDLYEYLTNNSDVVWYLASLVRVKHVNLATVVLFEAETEEEILYQIDKTFGTGAVSVFIEELCSIWNGASHFRSQATFKTFKGKEFDAIVSMHIPSNEEGFKNIPYTIIDISETIQINEELQKSEDRLNEAQHVAHMGNWELQFDKKVLYWSDEVYNIFEVEPHNLHITYDFFLSLVHPDDREYVDLSFKNSVESGKSYNIVHRLLLSNKTIKYVNERCITKYTECGVPISSVGTVHDITDRVKAEEALRESEKRFRNYIESAPLSICVIDAEWNLLEVNRFTTVMTGYPQDELMRSTVREMVTQEAYKKLNRNLLKVLKEGKGIFETSFIRKDGSLGFGLVEAVSLSDSTILAFIQDVTEKKALEEQLHQSEKMRAIGQLAGGIAHDFNNQLTGILGYAELLQDELKGREDIDSQYVDDILQGVKRASNLTSQLLAFSRKGKFLSRVVNVHDLINEVCRLLERTIHKNIVIEKSFKAQPATTLGDPTQLQNAILNLAINARDALPEGGTIEFHTANEELTPQFIRKHSLEIEAGKYLLIKVKDTGVGMDLETKRRIFEPFFTTKEQGKGTGMGLAAVYGTIKNHNGVILVDSTPGKGTIFSLYLPLSFESIDEDTLIAPAPIVAPKAASILVVDDDDVVRSVVKRMLEKSGYTVHLCSDGIDAVDYYREHYKEIDLVILDLVMPIMGGKRAFPLLKEINPDVIVLVSSGYSLEGEAQSILDAGAQQFIQKPFQKDLLVRNIHELLHDDL